MLKLFVIVLALVAGTLSYARPINRTPPAGPYPPGVTVPPQAAQWGYTKLVFYDDFSDSSDVDWGNQRIPGFKWYLNNRFQLVSNDFGAWSTAVPTPNDPAYVQRFKGGLNFLNVTISASTVDAMTNCYANPTAGALSGTSTGLSITGGYYTQATMQMQNLTHYLGEDFPFFFFGGPDFWNGSYNAGGSLAGMESVEVDIMEAAPTSGTVVDHLGFPNPGPNMHHWIFTTGENDTATFIGKIYLGIVPGTVTPTLNMSLSHSYGTLLVTEGQTTTGLAFQHFFIDGTDVGGETFSPSTSPSPALSPNSGVGFLTRTEGERKCFIFGSGRNWPSTISNIQVWQHP